MPLSMLAVRIPESQHKYIKFKAIDTGKQQQELMAEIIDFYQKHDTDYMQRFGQLIKSQASEEVTHGA